MNGSTIELALASDERFVMHLCVAAASLLKNADSSREIAFHIVHDGLSREAKSNFEALSSIRPFSVEWIGISHADFAEFEVPQSFGDGERQIETAFPLPSLGKASIWTATSCPSTTSRSFGTKASTVRPTPRFRTMA
jgi:hypothetical protein